MPICFFGHEDDYYGEYKTCRDSSRSDKTKIVEKISIN